MEFEKISNKTEEHAHNFISRSSIYRAKMSTQRDKRSKTDHEKKSNEIKTARFSSPVTPEEIAFSRAKMFYVFDTSTFMMLQSYLEDYGYEIIDLPFSKLLKERNKALNVIANAINFKKCYVTKNIMKEILEEEEKGTIRKGTSCFIESHFGIVDNESVLPEGESWQDILRAPTDEKIYAERYYKLIWDSMKLLERERSDVFIVTIIEDFTELGNANDIEVVSPWRIEYSW